MRLNWSFQSLFFIFFVNNLSIYPRSDLWNFYPKIWGMTVFANNCHYALLRTVNICSFPFIYSPWPKFMDSNAATWEVPYKDRLASKRKILVKDIGNVRNAKLWILFIILGWWKLVCDDDDFAMMMIIL